MSNKLLHSVPTIFSILAFSFTALGAKHHRGDQFIRPPYLQKGDTIAIVSPAAKMRKDNLADVYRIFESWGLHVKLGANAADTSQPYFAGTDAQRASDLQNAINDPSVKAIIAYEGGYGSVRLLPLVDFTPLLRHPKWIVGFSDITMLHLVMHRMKIESIHGTMPVVFSFDANGEPDSSIESLRKALFGETERIQTPHHPDNIPGRARGRLAGGNMVIITSASGTTEALLDKSPKVLLIEEVSEAAYRIDRMMQQMLRSGVLDNVTAIVAGHFVGVGAISEFGKTPYQIIAEYARMLGVPLICDFPSGHELPNFSVYFGREVTVDVTENGADLIFEKR